MHLTLFLNKCSWMNTMYNFLSSGWSFSMSGFATNTNHRLLHSLGHFNTCVSPAKVVSFDALLDSPMNQKKLASTIENKQFQLLYDASTIPNRTRLMSVSSNLAASWLSVVSSPGLKLHLDNDECQMWWLGIDSFGGSSCPFFQLIHWTL